MKSEEYSAKYKKYLDVLVGHLESRDVTNKLEAIEALSNLKDKSVTPKLKSLLADKTDFVRIETSRALYKLGDKSGIKVLTGILLTKVEVSPEDNPIKRAKMMAKNLTRAKAAEVLGNMGNKSVIEVLQKTAEDKNGQIKDASIIALIKLGEKSRIKVFQNALLSDNETVKVKACEVLGDNRESKAKEKIEELLTNWSKAVRGAAAVALGKLGDKKDGPFIAKLLDDQDALVRISAIEALGYLGDKSFVPQLKEKLNDKNGLVMLSAAEVLLKFGDDSVEGLLFTSLKSPDTDALIRTSSILRTYGKINSIEFLEDAYNNEKTEIVKINIAGTILVILKKEIDKKNDTLPLKR